MDEVTRAAATEEITVLHRYMEKNYQYKMTYFRFPKGEFSEDTLALAQELATRVSFGALPMQIGIPKMWRNRQRRCKR